MSCEESRVDPEALTAGARVTTRAMTIRSRFMGFNATDGRVAFTGFDRDLLRNCARIVPYRHHPPKIDAEASTLEQSCHMESTGAERDGSVNLNGRGAPVS